MKLGYAFFNPDHEILQHHAQELGVKYAVTNAGWAGKAGRFGQYTHAWDYMPLLKTKLSMNSFGLDFSVLEGVSFIDDVKLGTDQKDIAIQHFITLLKNMSELGIKTVCYNWMPVWEWFRTTSNHKLEGGATVTAFDRSQIPEQPISQLGMVSKDQFWTNLEYFLKKVVPYAEKYQIQLAIHPDDPPVDNIGGIQRILTSAEAMQQVIDLVPSEYNGITLCQGCFAAMGEDIPESIRRFGKQKKLFFAHFRDISGDLNKFNEEFHHTGKTDMYEAMKAYYEVGFDGVIRPDHVPTMYQDTVGEPGYGTNGNLFATGYMIGMMEAIEKELYGRIK